MKRRSPRPPTFRRVISYLETECYEHYLAEGIFFVGVRGKPGPEGPSEGMGEDVEASNDIQYEVEGDCAAGIQPQLFVGISKDQIQSYSR